MIKLKEIIKESKFAFDRKFGEPLPTLKDTMEKHTGRTLTEKKELDSKTIGYITRMTNTNNHNAARHMLASDFLGKNSPLVTSYKALMTLHDYLRDMNDLTKVRDKLDKKLFAGAERVYSNMDDIHKAF